MIEVSARIAIGENAVCDTDPFRSLRLARGEAIPSCAADVGTLIYDLLSSNEATLVTSITDPPPTPMK